jgi:uncharacterized membrane protein YfhO
VHHLAGEPRRAFLAPQVVVAGDAESLYAHLASPDFSVATAVVMGEAVEASAQQVTGQVQVLWDEPGHVALRTAAAEPAVLVLSESHYPGWQVRIDDQPARLMAADGALLAAYVPAGDHRVTFAFQPPILAWGAALTGGTLLTVAASVAWERRRRKD